MRTAVVVDDEPIIRMDLCEMLEGLEFSVAAQASDGFDAIELCRLHTPDLVLMDIKMPVFDGLSAAETIIEESLAGSVVILTAFYDETFWERAKEIGVSGYLLKPVSQQTLRLTVEIAMAQSARYQEALADVQRMKDALLERDLVDRAKAIVAERDGISESEAYAQLRKLSMNRQRSIGEISRMILDTDPTRKVTDQAKKLLMKRYHISENTAFRKIKELAERNGCTLIEAARIILRQESESMDGKRRAR